MHRRLMFKWLKWMHAGVYGICSTLFLLPLEPAHYSPSFCGYVALCACQSVVKVNMHESSKLNPCTNGQLSLPFHGGIYSMVAPLTNLSFKHENRKYKVHALEGRQSYSMLTNTKFPKLIYWDSLTLPMEISCRD